MAISPVAILSAGSWPGRHLAASRSSACYRDRWDHRDHRDRACLALRTRNRLTGTTRILRVALAAHATGETPVVPVASHKPIAPRASHPATSPTVPVVPGGSARQLEAALTCRMSHTEAQRHRGRFVAGGGLPKTPNASQSLAIFLCSGYGAESHLKITSSKLCISVPLCEI